ncbi:MAG: hypothetical protein J0L92_09940 [Deltaproteobacteria bacterium]|nr:hypothetical protein [Deltaproteobacteria bacterium]
MARDAITRRRGAERYPSTVGPDRQCSSLGVTEPHATAQSGSSTAEGKNLDVPMYGAADIPGVLGR